MWGGDPKVDPDRLCAKNRQESVENAGNPLLPPGIQQTDSLSPTAPGSRNKKRTLCGPSAVQGEVGTQAANDMVEHTVCRVRQGGQLCPAYP